MTSNPLTQALLRQHEAAQEIGELYRSSSQSFVDAVLCRLECGRRLVEQKNQLRHGTWLNWLRDNKESLGFGVQAAIRIMQAARKYGVYTQKQLANSSSTTNLPEPLTEEKAISISRDMWANEPKQEIQVDTHVSNSETKFERPIVNTVDVPRLCREHEERQKQERLMAEIAVQLIDDGFKVQSRKLHPDVGGSTEQMQRLNMVRDALKQAATNIPELYQGHLRQQHQRHLLEQRKARQKERRQQKVVDNTKPRLCIGPCKRLMMHKYVDGQWICTECGTPAATMPWGNSGAHQGAESGGE